MGTHGARGGYCMTQGVCMGGGAERSSRRLAKEGGQRLHGAGGGDCTTQGVFL